MAAGDLVTAAGQWHVEWAGMLLGWPATGWTLTNLDGWLTLPATTAANIDRQGRWGAFPGLQTVGTRTIEATFTYTGYGDPSVLADVRAALAPVENPLEQPLVVWAGTLAPELVYARVDKVAIPSDYDFSMGYHRVTVQWVATNPLRYGLTPMSVSTRLPFTDVNSGLHFNPAPHTDDALHFDLNFGGARGGGVCVINNSRYLAVWPTFIIDGPVDGPAVDLIEGGTGRLAMATTYSVPAGRSLVLDTDKRYPSEGPTGATPDDTFQQYSDPGRTGWVGRDSVLDVRDWFALPPGHSKLRFSAQSSSPDALLTVFWRTAAVL